MPFQFYMGARGIGKTYSALLGHYRAFKDGTAGKLIYMRLTSTEIEQSATAYSNPYKRICYDEGLDIRFEPSGKKQYAILDYTGCGEDDIPEQVGYGVSLSSLGALRGADFSDASELYFDEFLAAESVVKTAAIKKAGYLFANAYETIARNRELLGQPPLRCYLTANAFGLDSDILMRFNLVDTIEHMQRHGQKRYTDKSRGIYIELCDAHEVSAAKAGTALYQAMASDKEFTALALENKFQDYVLSLIKRDVPLNEYNPVMSYKSITIWKHKSNGTLYACRTQATVPKDCAFYESTRGQFLVLFYDIYKCALIDRMIYFSDAATKYELDAALDKTTLKL